MTELLTALALALALEGVVYALFPDSMKRFMARVLEMPETSLRIAGIFAAMIGVAALAIIRLGI